MLYAFSYIWNLIRQQTYNKAETDSDIENKLVVAGREGGMDETDEED